MKRDIVFTADGSHTLYLPEIDEHYHSTFGAIQESKHVFINAGLKAIQKESLCVFEVGFGTGLNALLTLVENQTLHKKINYISIEKYPLTKTEYSRLNYGEINGTNWQNQFIKMHTCKWEENIEIDDFLLLTKIKGDIIDFDYKQQPPFDLIYFDAFAPNKQGDVWDSKIFNRLYQHCNKGALLVTYCAKGEVRRNLQSAGFQTERIPGPPGKREMLRATKV